jgi:multidrug resistance efflux pump
MQQKTVRAPFSGVVAKRQKVAGDVLQFGETIYSFCDPNRIWVEAIIPEKEIAKVVVGQAATVQLLIDKHRQWTGAVSWIAPVALPSGDGVPIRIELEKTNDTV